MSAYGKIERVSTVSSFLPSTVWSTRSVDSNVTIHHLRRDSAPPELVKYLSQVFIQEVQIGRTYPQEGAYDIEAFMSYFLAEDLFVGILGKASLPQGQDMQETSRKIDESRSDQTWEECVVGCYYVKPNYPGRSSHICNAGFIVAPSRRKGGYGSLLAKSYVYYAPKLGYSASVFNLVYANNEASIR
jgi:hypothetical protein